LAREGWLSDRLRQAANQWPIERLLVWPPRSAPRPRGIGRRLLVGSGLAALAVMALILTGRSLFTTKNEASSPNSGTRPIGAFSMTSDDERRFAELERAIEREACAAQLAMSAELLAAEAAAEHHAEETMSLVAEAFPETKAGRDAARRAGSRRRGAIESL
jgi:hypothetical protein